MRRGSFPFHFIAFHRLTFHFTPRACNAMKRNKLLYINDLRVDATQNSPDSQPTALAVCNASAIWISQL